MILFVRSIKLFWSLPKFNKTWIVCRFDPVRSLPAQLSLPWMFSVKWLPLGKPLPWLWAAKGMAAIKIAFAHKKSVFIFMVMALASKVRIEFLTRPGRTERLAFGRYKAKWAGNGNLTENSG